MAEPLKYRVWPDGTVQEVHETPYSWLSYDYQIVEAEDEEDALRKATLNETRTNPPPTTFLGDFHVYILRMV